MKQQKQQKEYGKKFFVPILLILAVLPYNKRNEFRIYLVSIYVYFKYIRQTRAKIGKNPVKISRVSCH